MCELASTPININNLQQELLYHPDKDFVSYLITGLVEGFDIGYFGPEIDRISRNLTSAINNPACVDHYLEVEIDAGRILGPFDEKPFEKFQCNPIGIVPKKTPGKFRAIMDLSYPHGDSINDFIDKEEFSLRYVTVDRAVEYILELGEGCYLNKIDIENAFRIIPVSPL